MKMKKIIFLFILAALLTSCKKNDAPTIPDDNDMHKHKIVDNVEDNDVENLPTENPETSTPTLPEDNTESVVTDTEDDKYTVFDYAVTARTWDDIHALPLEKRATEFLSALCIKDKEVLDFYIDGDSVEELLKFNINAEIGEGRTVDVRYSDDVTLSSYILDVKLTVFGGKEGIMSNGSYYLTLKISDSTPLFVEYFGTRERYEAFEGANIPSSDEKLYQTYTFLEQVFHERNLICENGFDLDQNFDNIFHAAVHDLMTQGEEDYILKTTLDGFKDYIRQRFGYTDESVIEKFADKFVNSYFVEIDDDGFYVGSCAHGYSRMAKELSNVEKIDGTAVYTYTLFSDSACTVPCAEVVFTFINGDDFVMTLKSFEFKPLNDLEISVVTP